jgi:hypothetical protein
LRFEFCVSEARGGAGLLDSAGLAVAVAVGLAGGWWLVALALVAGGWWLVVAGGWFLSTLQIAGVVYKREQKARPASLALAASR